MPRSGSVKKRILPPDLVYNSRLVTKLINRIMRDGKKTIAQKHVYRALDLISQKTKKNPLEIFVRALENIKPLMEVRPRRIGGAAYQVPMSVRTNRQESLAIRWLIEAARLRSNKEYRYFYEKLAAEILDAQQNQGGAVKKRQDVHRMAEANKAFAHFRW